VHVVKTMQSSSAIRDQFGRETLESVADRLGVHVVYPTGPGGVEGALIDGGCETERQLSLFTPDIAEARIRSRGLRSRFTLAHELAHAIADQVLTEQQTAGWQSPDWTIFLDAIAAELLLPSRVVLAYLAGEPAGPRLTLERLTRMSTRLSASVTVVVVRLQELVLEGAVSFADGVLLAAPGLSAVERRDFGPRVVASCVPEAWFIPQNKRLSSLGAPALARLVSRGELGRVSSLRDDLTVWERTCRRSARLERMFRCLVVRTATSGVRFLIATFPVEETA
jgi:hypothetical protein